MNTKLPPDTGIVLDIVPALHIAQFVLVLVACVLRVFVSGVDALICILVIGILQGIVLEVRE